MVFLASVLLRFTPLYSALLCYYYANFCSTCSIVTLCSNVVFYRHAKRVPNLR